MGKLNNGKFKKGMKKSGRKIIKFKITRFNTFVIKLYFLLNIQYFDAKYVEIVIIKNKID